MQKKILVIEDEFEIRKDILKTLSLSDYQTYSAGDGASGLELAKKFKPDLIISDIMMPKLDGFSVLRELQKLPETSTIPFLFLSAKSERSIIREGMNLGADDFITKPYDINDLLEAIQLRLKKHEELDEIHTKKLELLSDSIHRSIPHEVRTPISLILGYSDYLMKKFDKLCTEETKEMISNIYEAGKRLNKLLDNQLLYIKLLDILSKKEEIVKYRQRKTFFAEYLIKDLIFYLDETNSRMSDFRVSLRDATLKISEEYFIKMIKEVIDNALKFSETGSAIDVKSRISGSNYYLTFRNTGRGMTEEEIKTIGAYMQFERNVYEQQGSGLGLAIVQKILELHEGSLEIKSIPDEYTEITLIMKLG